MSNNRIEGLDLYKPFKVKKGREGTPRSAGTSDSGNQGNSVDVFRSQTGNQLNTGINGHDPAHSLFDRILHDPNGTPSSDGISTGDVQGYPGADH